MLIEYNPFFLAGYINSSSQNCPVCSQKLDVKTQFLYTKTYKDECPKCTEYINDSIYCLCQNDNFYMKLCTVTCDHCSKCIDKQKKRLVKDSVIKCDQSYKELYKLAKLRGIKYRSLMSKSELYEALQIDTL